MNIHPIVVVTDYYDPFPTVGTNCIDTQALNKIIGITDTERKWLVSQLINLNSGIQTTVAKTKTTNPNIDLRFVELAATSTTTNVMSGHQYCSSDPWVYGPSIQFPALSGGSGDSTSPAPFHPSPAGQAAISIRINSALS